MPVSQHTIAGTTLTMPIEIRRADLHSAMFLVPAGAAQQLIDYSGLQVSEYLPGRALAALMLVRYHDGDLGKYHEFGTAIMVRPPGSTSRRDSAAFIHHLPVDQAFTLEAGTKIWGYPKVMADFAVRDRTPFSFDLSIDGELVAGMEFDGRRLSIPARLTSRGQTLRSYTHRDGTTREVTSVMTPSGVRFRPGGARLWLGDHPYAKELRTLGLPRRPIASATVANVTMHFDDAHVLD